MFNRKFVVLLAAVVLLMVGFAINTTTVSAAKGITTLDSLSVGCSSVTFTFTTNINITEVSGIRSSGTSNELFVIPVSGAGTHTISVNYNEVQASGAPIYLTFGITAPVYQNIFFGVYTCEAGFAGPAVPEGWTQRWMACSSAVFDAPGGKPIGDDAVWAGQSFYVNPEPKLDASGKSWSQVFVSSYTSPWIPTSCVK